VGIAWPQEVSALLCGITVARQSGEVAALLCYCSYTA